MLETIGLGFLTALAVCIIMWKINLQFFAMFHWQADLLVSAGLAILFMGTFSGIMTAAIAGIFVSIFLSLARRFVL